MTPVLLPVLLPVLPTLLPVPPTLLPVPPTLPLAILKALVAALIAKENIHDRWPD